MEFKIITTVFAGIGGLGMFLYGMHVMSEGLQKKSGDKLRNLLNILTSNKYAGIVVGALITAIIQSSSATTVMVVGFVNSGLMTLVQAVGVIMGANIGTTITAWIVSLNDIGSFLKPENMAPAILGLGVFMVLFSKRQHRKDVGEIFVGFSLIFIGLGAMASATKPLASNKAFIDVFGIIANNPILAIVIGLVVTAIIQSSSASIGILQTLTATGSVTFGAAAFITLGQNIGTCVTALLSSAGTSRIAKRAAVIHLLFNVIGSGIFAIVLIISFKFIWPWIDNSTTNSFEISIFHTIFNISNTLLLLPFAKLLVKISEKIIPLRIDQEEVDVDDASITKNRLDKRLLGTPAVALNLVKDEVYHLAGVVEKNLNRVKKLVIDNNKEQITKILDKEKCINEMTILITQYIVEVSKLKLLTNMQRVYIDDLLYTVSDIERVGDHCENIAELMMDREDDNKIFSDKTLKELNEVIELSIKSFNYAILSRHNNDRFAAIQAIKCEQKIDFLEEEYRRHYLQRLTHENADIEISTLFLNIISNLERVSDHASNIAEYVQKENVNEENA